MKTTIQVGQRSRGSMVLIVMVLLAAIGGLIICNTRTLYHLKRELNTVEKRQIQHWTNAPALQPTGNRP